MDNWNDTEEVDRRRNDVEPTYKCTICNIDVPKMYWKLHNDSTKHKTCLDIAIIAIERVKENMLVDIPTTCPNDSSTYFCESCATAVDIIQRTDHEASKTHKDSLQHDKLLSDLFNIYKDKNNMNILNSNNTNDTNNDINHVNSQRRRRVRRNRHKDNGNNDSKEELRVLNKHIVDINDDLEPDSYIYIINDEHLHITIDYCLFKVHVRNFNGIYMFPTYNQWKCLLCNQWLDRKADIITHCDNESHIKNIKLKIKDKECVRLFEVPGEITSPYLHCILCNKRMHKDLINYHIENEEHIIAFNNSLIYEQNDSDKIYCRICEMNVFVYNYSSHEKGMRHMSNLKRIAPDPDVENGDTSSTIPNRKPTNDPSRLHYAMKVTTNPNEMICEICEIIIPNNVKYMNDHINGKRHTYKYNQILSNNTIRHTETGFYCVVCRVNVPVRNELTHIYGRNHQDNIAKEK